MHPLWKNVEAKVTVRGAGCWLATRCLNYKGYCVVTKAHIRAHRISWEHHFGPIPDGLLVLHSCDVPNCVNPNHLFLGTNADNMADKMRKGRHKYNPKGLSLGAAAAKTLERDWHGRFKPR